MIWRIYVATAAMVLAAAETNVQAAEQLQANGWTLTAEPEQGRLTIAREGLGIVLRNARIGLGEAHMFASWTARKSGAGRLEIKTNQPRTGWMVELAPNALIISSTSGDGVVTAEVPATPERTVARTMDPEGVPVDWIGTQEVQGGYGGEVTHNRSFLPRENPDVLYFALGAVSASTFHSLFDRKTDTAIEFGGGSDLKRSDHDASVLDLKLRIPGNAILRVIPDYFTKTLGVPYYTPFDDRVFSHAPMVWSSWTSYYEAVREQDIVKNADWLAANLKPYGFQFVQLDDGYDRDAKGQHDWIENWDRQKFPHGPEWLTAYIKSKGLRAGIWLVPNAYAGAVTQHPEWYLRYKKDGSIVKDYNTPALDSTNPQALEQVKKIMTTLDEWGFDYYKFDGEHALPRYVPGVDRGKLHDANVDLLENYRARLKMIRETIGPNRFIEGCPAGTPLNGIGFFNSYFTGHDLYNNWQGMYPLFSSISANGFLNHVLVYVMPGEGIELGLPMTVEEAKTRRPPIVVETARTREEPMIGFGLNDAEARTVVSYVSLTGVAYPLASVMPELPPERVQLLKQTMPTMPILPVDLFSRGTDMQWNTFKHTQADYYIHNYPEILDLKVNAASGVYDVVALTNWRSAPATRTVAFGEKLGLEPGHEYLAFDFWNREFLGAFKDHLQVDVAPHDTRVLLIRPVVDHPQLLGNSRHISGAYSITKLSWDGSAAQLRGTSETVKGEPYTLFVHVPRGYKPLGVRMSAGTARISLKTDVAVVDFPGGGDPVDWTVEFTR